jgi:hypothetical protein
MATLEKLAPEILCLITDGLSPCNIALLMSTTPTMKKRMLSGGVRRLTFDSLAAGRVVTFSSESGSCVGGTCSCLLKWLRDFTHINAITMNEDQFEKCLGASAAPYQYGLPSCLKSFTLVLRTAFLRWMGKRWRSDYPLGQMVPNLRSLKFGEWEGLEEAVDSLIKIDKTFAAAPFAQFMSSLPANLETLILPPLSHTMQNNLLPSSITRSSIALKWPSSLDGVSVPKHLVSLSLFIHDSAVLDRSAKEMFPPSLTELRLHLRVKEDAAEPSKPKWISKLPAVSSLHLTNVDNLSLQELPSVLTSLTLVYFYPSKGKFDSKGWAPEYLTKFSVKRWPALEDLGSLPKCIDHLVLKTEHPMVLTKMPESLTRMTVPANASFASPHWPLKLHTLVINPLTTVNSDVLVTFPKSLTSVSFSVPANADVALLFQDLPTSIKHLQLWNRKLDGGIFAALKNSQLESLEVFPGDAKKDLVPVEVSRWKWSLLEDLPATLKLLRLPVQADQFEPVSLPNLAQLLIHNTTIGFENLQLALVLFPNIRRILAKEFKIETNEIDNANKVLSSNPLLTLRSINQHSNKKQ